MLFVAVLAAVSCVALSVPPSCTVGEWGEWSECKTGQNMDPPKSYHVSKEEKAKGNGRKQMAKLMYLKRQASLEKQRCKAAGTCPEMFSKPSVTGALTECVDGFAGEYPCDKIDMLAFIDFQDLGFPGNVEGNDIWVWHDTENGDHYALMGTTAGTSFVRVTDPVNPVVVGHLDTTVTDPVNPVVVGHLGTTTTSSTWRDMKVIGNFAYIVSEASGHGMQVFDLTRLRGLESNPDRAFDVDALYTGVSNTHNIVANAATNTVFLVGSTRNADDICNGGLHMVDVSDPLNPTLSACFGSDGYVHDAECVNYDGPDTRYTGREICFCYNEDTFTIFDVTDRNDNSLEPLSRVAYEGVYYSHQGWATEDLRYVLLDDELDEAYTSNKNTRTYVWDIADLEDPLLVNTFQSAETAIDHNLYIRGNYAHQTNYEAGYRILTLNNLPELSEVAYFDVYPPSTTANFYGSWSNYPWLEDADGQFTVVSSIDYGLFILRPRWDEIEAAERSASHIGEMQRFRETIYGKEGAQCPHLVETKKCVA